MCRGWANEKLSMCMIPFAILQIYDPARLSALALPPPISACLPDAKSRETSLYPVVYGLLMAFDLVVMGLTLYKSVKLHRQARQAGPGNSLLEVLIRDQVITYVAVAAVAIVNVSAPNKCLP